MMNTRTYTMVYLGSNAQYDVYDIVLYPTLLADDQTLKAYKDDLSQTIVRAKAAGRKFMNSLSHIMRISFRHAVMPSCKAALPPDFVPNVANDTEATE